MGADKYFITGFSGFVAKHFLEFLNEQETKTYVLGVDLHVPEFSITGLKYVHCSFEQVDLLNKDVIDNIIYEFQPNYILHLASFSSVAFSWKNPVASFANNTNIFLNLLEKVRTLNLNCRILSIGSSEEYGNVKPGMIPLEETSELNPISPYAVARVSQEMLSRIYATGYGMDVIMTRSFNHIGPGQKDIFVISSFAKQLVEIKKFNKRAEVHTGDLSVVRDFLDVRDVVKAYYTLFQKGRKGEIYNVCSGRGYSLNQVVEQMAQLLDLSVKTITDPSLLRPDDNRIIIGSNKKLSMETGWTPSYSLEDSLSDILNYWQHRI